MPRDEMINKVIAYFEENEEEFIQAIEELDSYNGYLGDDRIYYMEDINDFYTSVSALDILARAFYGYDADTYTTDSRGDREYGPFNPNREYFYYNGYGNLVSTDYKDYSDMLDEYFVEALISDRNNLTLPDEVEELLNNIENEED